MANNKKNTKKKSDSSSKFVFWVIGIIVVFIIGFIFLGNHQKPAEQQTAKETIDYSNQPFLGEKNCTCFDH